MSNKPEGISRCYLSKAASTKEKNKAGLPVNDMVIGHLNQDLKETEAIVYFSENSKVLS